ncbi:S-methyl-5'-thioadenosine phosphorylase [Jatrophihabitans telluris]|uniref:Purine nucleoside phosphorylase n=1 Tax=Jatrophihabitans telluris TaxID=2038343 RepID=A0ABY4QWP2_9ACTN|nr:S-methyl-5'-thioadenosine phosphorylase [Jatrophihabitans telluris]UQX87778.1 S-methyl-5'-thioadenosine phosphorylase [Jatrophihabitans telluris]
MTNIQAEIGVIGGSGFYSLLSDAAAVTVRTPWGDPSGEITVGRLGERQIAFLPRHGADHRFPPHRVPYRANLWALRSLGVRQIVSASAVGSLKPELGPGTIVVPDQIIDRTYGRGHTYNDSDSGVAHVSFSDPYSVAGRAAALRGSAAAGIEVVDGGTLIVINGPRFSTRAESLDYQRRGASIIGMTGMPEAALARELALEFTGLCLVTDHDAGVEVGGGVTHAEVLEQFATNLPRLRELLVATLSQLPALTGNELYGEVYGNTPPPFELP